MATSVLAREGSSSASSVIVPGVTSRVTSRRTTDFAPRFRASAGSSSCSQTATRWPCAMSRCRYSSARCTGHAAHRDVRAIVPSALGEHDAERAARDLGILEEQLVEIAHAIEEEAIGIGRLDLDELRHDGRNGGARRSRPFPRMELLARARASLFLAGAGRATKGVPWGRPQISVGNPPAAAVMAASSADQRGLTGSCRRRGLCVFGLSGHFNARVACRPSKRPGRATKPAKRKPAKTQKRSPFGLWPREGSFNAN